MLNGYGVAREVADDAADAGNRAQRITHQFFLDGAVHAGQDKSGKHPVPGRGIVPVAGKHPVREGIAA